MRHHPYPDETPDLIKARMICGDPAALGYAWIEAYNENLNNMLQGHREDDYEHYGITVDELIDTALTHVEDGWSDYIVRGGVFEGFSMDPTFWDKLAALKGIDIPSDKRGTIFSCSC